MIRDIIIKSGNYKVYISIDENILFKNTWTRTGGSQAICPSSGIWEMGGGSNSNYLYLLDNKSNNILYLLQLSKKVGDIGLGQSLSSNYGIAKNVIFNWEITSVKSELQDKL